LVNKIKVKVVRFMDRGIDGLLVAVVWFSGRKIKLSTIFFLRRGGLLGISGNCFGPLFGHIGYLLEVESL